MLVPSSKKLKQEKPGTHRPVGLPNKKFPRTSALGAGPQGPCAAGMAPGHEAALPAGPRPRHATPYGVPLESAAGYGYGQGASGLGKERIEAGHIESLKMLHVNWFGSVQSSSCVALSDVAKVSGRGVAKAVHSKPPSPKAAEAEEAIGSGIGRSSKTRSGTLSKAQERAGCTKQNDADSRSRSVQPWPSLGHDVALGGCGDASDADHRVFVDRKRTWSGILECSSVCSHGPTRRVTVSTCDNIAYGSAVLDMHAETTQNRIVIRRVATQY
jgi:hypothetical protein